MLKCLLVDGLLNGHTFGSQSLFAGLEGEFAVDHLIEIGQKFSRAERRHFLEGMIADFSNTEQPIGGLLNENIVFALI